MPIPPNETELLLAARNHYVSESLRYSKMADELTERLNGASGQVHRKKNAWTPERRRQQSLAQKRRWKKLRAAKKK